MNDVVPDVPGVDEPSGSPAGDEAAGRRGPSGERSARAAAAVFGAYVVGAFIWLVTTFDDRYWFIGDDWGVLVGRSLSDPASWFVPLNTHWLTVPTLVYQGLYQVVGLRSYLPYAVVVMVAHLTLAVLLRLVMRRAGVGPWVATVVAGTFVLYGTGERNIWFAIQMSLVLSLVAGVGHLILADHDGPFDRRDALGLAVGTIGLMSSGVGPEAVAMVGLAVLIRRGWRLALVHTVPLGVLYVAWYAWQRPAESGGGSIRSSIPGTLDFVRNAMVGVFEGLGQSSVAAVALVALIGFGLVLAWSPLRGAELRRAVAAPGSMLVAALLVLAGAGSQRYLMGEDFARQSRYVAMGTALVLPAIGVASAAIIRRWRLAAPAVALVVLVGVPGNLALFGDVDQTESTRYAGEQKFLLGATESPLAREVSPDALPYPGEGDHQATIGFLLAARDAGRLPPTPELDDSFRAKIDTRLALSQNAFSVELPGATCAVHTEPLEVMPAKGEQFAFDGALVVDRWSEADGAYTGGTSYTSTWTGRVLTSQLEGQRFRIRPAASAPSFTWCTAP